MEYFWSNVPIQKNDGYWYLVETALSTGFTKSEKGPYQSKDEAIKNLKELKKKQSKQIDKDISVIERSIDNGGYIVDGDDVHDEEELQAKKDEFNQLFTKQEESCLNDAKKLLSSIAKIYLDADIIDNNDYINTKIKLESESLSSVIFQIKTSRMAIHRICEDIVLGNYTSKTIETLTQLQRVVLDISKFQHQYMTSVENAFKSISDNEIGSHVGSKTINTNNVIELTKSKGTSIYTNRSQLIQELNEFVEISNSKNKVAASYNKNLPVDDDMLDPINNHDVGEISIDGDIAGSGLDSFPY